MGLIVLQQSVPVAVGALKAWSLPTHQHLEPWAAAGFVLPALRGKGIGAVLLDALANQAFRLGYSSVYCATAKAAGLLRRCGWAERQRAEHEGESLVIFQKAAAQDFVASGGPQPASPSAARG